MTDTTISVLLVEDDPADAELIKVALADAVDNVDRPTRYRVEWVRSLSGALEVLGRIPAVEVVLLDLALPDSNGIDAFDKIFAAAQDALVLVLTGATAEEDEIRRAAVARGAHDYFSKAHIDAHWLPRALQYVIERVQVRAELLSSETRFRAMSDASPLGILVSDADGSCTYVNAAWESISGRDADQMLGQHWSTAIHPEDCPRAVAEWQAALHSREFFMTEVRYLRKDGNEVWARINAAAMWEGKPLRSHVQTVEDISQRKADELVLAQAEEALFDEKERAQVTLNSIGDAVLCTDMQGRITYLNAVAETMTGWSRDDAVGKSLSEVFRVIDGKTREPAEDPARRAIDEDCTVGLAFDSVLIRRDGFEAPIEDSAAPIHNRAGQVTGAVIVFHDVSQSRAMANRMTHLAQHDFLTGLPNRVLLTERLSQAIGLARRNEKQVALLFLDLDHFKHINDSLGHAIGDQLLQSVGVRLASCTRITDTVCRMGGDEFVILLPEIEHPQDAGRVAEALRAAFLVPHQIDGHELHITLSVGIAIHPGDGLSAEILMQNADTAMYHAKGGGRNNYQFFRTEMNTRAVRRQFLESSLRRALTQQEFVLHYQPKVNMVSGDIIGAEALIRWQDPEEGMIYPMQFVPVAEECGLMIPIGQWVLREACRQVKAWLDDGLAAVPVSVNISAMEFRHGRFLECLAEILRETGLPPEYLELELTETILMHHAESSVSVLEALKRMGVKLAIDDFGTGYSSLSYLKRFPIDALKIDQSFVRDITSSEGDAILVSAVIGMGRSLGQRVVAEGVETTEQLSFLQEQQCDEGQGFLFGYPLPGKEFSPLLAAQAGRFMMVVSN